MTTKRYDISSIGATVEIGKKGPIISNENNAINLSGIQYPTVDGSNGQILATDGNGVLSFIDNDTEVTWITKDINDDGEVLLGGERILANTTSGSFTLNLPANPTVNQKIKILPLYPSYDVNPLVIGRNGQRIMASDSDLNINELAASIVLEYVGTVGTDDIGWAVTRIGDVSLINNIDESGVGLYIELTEGGQPTFSTHTHSAVLTNANVEDLIQGNVPSVTITSSLNEGHNHDITCEYSQGSIFVSNVAGNHLGDEHDIRIVNSNNVYKPWEIVTTADAGAGYNIESRDRILADSTGGSFNIVLPTSPSIGDALAIAPLTPTYYTDPVTIIRSGELINSETEDVLLNQIGLSLELIFVGGSVGWAILEKGETTVVNNFIVDGGIVVATQPGNNTFTGSNTFTGVNDFTSSTSLFPTPDSNSSPNEVATVGYVDSNVPSNVALLDTDNTYSSGVSNDFTSGNVFVKAPTSGNNPATRSFVEQLVASNIPTGVAILSNNNIFTGQNSFNDETTFNSNVDFQSSTSFQQSVTLNGITNNGSYTQTSPNFQIGDANSLNIANFEIGSSITINPANFGIVDIAGKLKTSSSNTLVTLGSYGFQTNAGDTIVQGDSIKLDSRGTDSGDNLTLDSSTTIEVNAPFNINANNGGSFNVVNDPGSTLVFQSGGDLEITAGLGGDLWLQGLRMPNADGLSGQSLVTNGSGTLSFASTSFDTSDDYSVSGEWQFDNNVTFENLVTINGGIDDKVYIDSFDTSVVLQSNKKYVIASTTSSTRTFTLNDDSEISGTGEDLYNVLPTVDVWHVGYEFGTSVVNISSPDTNNIFVNGEDSGSTLYSIPQDQKATFIRMDGNWHAITSIPPVNENNDSNYVYVTGQNSYTISATDNGKTIELDNASTVNLTVNSNLGDEFTFTIIQGGDGKVLWDGNGTAVINNVDGHTRSRGIFSLVTFISRIGGTFVVGGATE